MDERLAVLEQKYYQIAEKLESIEKKAGPQKDPWDILSATTPLITGLLISGIGLYFAYTNNQAQLKIQETQTVEKFIPHLIGSEPEKKAAIIALSTITNTQTAAKYAELFPSEGTASALKSIVSSSNSNNSDKKLATRALANTFHQMADTYQSTQNSPAAEQAYTQSINEQEKLVGKDSPELIDNLNQLAEAYKTQAKYTLAEAALRRVSKIQESTYGSRSPQFIESLNKLAQVFRLEGKTDTALHLTDYADLLAKQIAPVSTASDDSHSQSRTVSNTTQDAQQNKQATANAGDVMPNATAAKSDITVLSNKHNTQDPAPTNNSAPANTPAPANISAPASPSAPTLAKDTNPLSTANNSQKPTL